ncbi:DNA adenine methylase [Blastococcus sp. SYSU DS0669]
MSSPLRYPGAKRQLVPFFADLLRAQPEPIETFVEPFAGGASVSLHLAAAGLVERVVLGERDDLLYSFWKVACDNTAWLIDAVEQVPVTLETWDRFKANPGTRQKDKALAALFLNRTSFSGILHRRSGPIGGRAQTGPNPIDCRFTKPTIIRRLKAVGALAKSGRIAAVRRGSYEKTIAWATARYGRENTLVYLDPPFWDKAATLYRRSFVNKDHLKLCDYLVDSPDTWLLSYDAHPAVEQLYRSAFTPLPPLALSSAAGARVTRGTGSVGTGAYGARVHLIDLRYNAHSSRRGTQELVVTNLPVAPDGYLRGTRTR